MRQKLMEKKRRADTVMEEIADYLVAAPTPTVEAYQTAHLCLADALGCALLALQYPACNKFLGPVVPGTKVPNGCVVPGTSFCLDPIRAALNLGAMIRWLDYNDTWLAMEWGHPSDNIGGLLPLLDFLSRKNRSDATPSFSVKDLLLAMIRAYEIQGVLSISNSFNSIGLDHVILVKVATAAVATSLLGGNQNQIVDAISQAWVDGAPLRAYRHAPNVGSRKSWAAGDAASRGIEFALMTMKGEMGYPRALSAEQWGMCDRFFNGEPITLSQPLGCHVMENVLFKVSYPAEFHAQTAVEAAVALRKKIAIQLDTVEATEMIDLIEVETQEPAMRIIDKTGPLTCPADRDHCLQYMVAIALLHGTLSADHYEQQYASDPRVDALRAKMVVSENPQFSREYLDPEKRSIANAITIRLKGGRKTEKITIQYPLGHRRRREEAEPLLWRKFESNLSSHLSPGRVKLLLALFADQQRLDETLIPTMVDMLCEFNGE